uniref:Lipocalin n=1 Tax=Rhipicephalus appendiculatus TaxID=34631 RepID=A0A131YIF8_RHIAP
MKFLTTVLARVIWCIATQGSQSTGQGMTTIVSKVLSSGTPTVLLWGEGNPDPQQHTCWKAVYGTPGPGTMIPLTLYGGWIQDTGKQTGKPKKEHAEIHVTLFTKGGKEILKVEKQSHNAVGSLAEGEHTILYASLTCFILQSPSKNGGKPKCTAWVPADTAGHLHSACKRQFINLCDSCKQST